ncbi:MAG: lipoyl(octanoyl) transferase LipB [Deltaproteobacteria bacterium]|nr:lipoyl(octanoyl) transferase LipB [Deltaproteobacteria bacterium]
MTAIQVRWLGLVPYRRGLELQEQAARGLRERPQAHEMLFVLQHPPVITLGRHAGREDVLVDDATLVRRGIDVVRTERGGQATVHAPGQVVVYPILHLLRRRLGPARLVELLEAAMIDTCRTFGVAAARLPPHPGVWVAARDGRPARKLGAIGLRISSGVSMHGIALNVNNDLSLYSAIVPCGLQELGTTSLREELGRDVDLGAVEHALAWAVQTELEAGEEARRTPPSARPAGGPFPRRGAAG